MLTVTSYPINVRLYSRNFICARRLISSRLTPFLLLALVARLMQITNAIQALLPKVANSKIVNQFSGFLLLMPGETIFGGATSRIFFASFRNKGALDEVNSTVLQTTSAKKTLGKNNIGSFSRETHDPLCNRNFATKDCFKIFPSSLRLAPKNTYFSLCSYSTFRLEMESSF